MSKSIEIDGKAYIVADDLGFDVSAGRYAAFVQVDGGERCAVKYRGGTWKWHKPFILPKTNICGQ